MSGSVNGGSGTNNGVAGATPSSHGTTTGVTPTSVKPTPQMFGSYSYGSSHGTARGGPGGLFSPTYSPALGLPQSSLRSGTFLERHDEDSAEEDEDEMDNHHSGRSLGYNKHTLNRNGNYSSSLRGTTANSTSHGKQSSDSSEGSAAETGARGSEDAPSPDEMEWETNDMEM